MVQSESVRCGKAFAPSLLLGFKSGVWVVELSESSRNYQDKSYLRVKPAGEAEWSSAMKRERDHITSLELPHRAVPNAYIMLEFLQ